MIALKRVLPLLLLGCAAGLVCACSDTPRTPVAPGPIVNPPPPPPPPPPAPVPQLTKLRYLAFGDSLTTGDVKESALHFALTPGLPVSYPYKLQAMLSARYSDQQLVAMNAGLDGERASDARPRLLAVLEEANAEVVLLFDGANDLLALGEDGIPATVDAMKDLVRAIRASGATPVILTQPPQRPGTDKTAAAPFIPIYNRDLKRLADVEQVQVIDLFEKFDVALQGPDGLHPSAEGYTRIAEIVFEGIKALYEKPAAAASPSR